MIHMRHTALLAASMLVLAAPAQAALIGTLSYVQPTATVVRGDQIDIYMRLTLSAGSDPLIINADTSISAASFSDYAGPINLSSPNTFIGLGNGLACANQVFCGNRPFPQSIYSFTTNGGTAVLGNNSLTLLPGTSYEWLAGAYLAPALGAQLPFDLAGTFALPTRSLTFTAFNGGAEATLATIATCSAGATCASRTIVERGNGSSANSPLLPGTVNTTTGGSNFLFPVNSANQTVFIDPLVASGYDYVVTAGANITSALFPALGDGNGYQIFALSGGVTGSLLGTVADGGLFTFAPGGVSAFALRDISTALALSPTNPVAFVTGLTFNVSGPTNIAITQTPVTTFIDPNSSGAVPEPATWLSMILGFGMLGGVIRRRQQTAVRFAI
jgi:hypothetical protein